MPFQLRSCAGTETRKKMPGGSFSADKLLVKSSETGTTIPRTSDVAALNQNFSEQQYLGAFKETGCFVAELDDAAGAPAGNALPESVPCSGFLSR